MFNKDALEYLVDLGVKRQEIKKIEGFNYSTERLHRITEPKAAALETNSLTSLVDYVNSRHVDLEFQDLMIHVQSPTRVALYGALDKNRERECFMMCKAIIPDSIRYDVFLDPEKFNIMLQSAFVDLGDRAALLKVTGSIKDENITEVGDNGVSQGVKIKTGVASINEVLVPNPVTLTPYRSFQEIEQVESKFIFRMQSGPRAALFEADGNMWRNEAMIRIKEYLKKNVPEEIDVLG